MIGNHYEIEKRECELCHGKIKSSKVLAHHLSYDPEIIIYLCRICHINLHTFAKYDDIQRKKFIEWIEQFGKQWENGTEKFLKSEYLRKYVRNWQKNSEVRQKWLSKFRDEKGEGINAYKRKWRQKRKQLGLRVT